LGLVSPRSGLEEDRRADGGRCESL
jgi:hypothetical protein